MLIFIRAAVLCTYKPSHRHQHTGVPIPIQEWVLAIPRLGILDIRPPLDKILVTHDLRQLPRGGPVHILNHVEISREENVEIALVDLFSLEKVREFR